MQDRSHAGGARKKRRHKHAARPEEPHDHFPEPEQPASPPPPRETGPLVAKFSELPGVCEQTQRALATKFQFDTMTEVQQKAIPALLAGEDVIGAARTGSGCGVLRFSGS